MLGYLLGNTPYYTVLFLILPFIVDTKYIKICASYSLVMALDQTTTVFVSDDTFFLVKALFDLAWLLVTCIFVKGRLFKVLTLFILISFSFNVYLCFDVSVNTIYAYWNELNFILFECILMALLSTSPIPKKINIWLATIPNTLLDKNKIKRISICEEK